LSKKVLITGINGFVGYHLVKLLLDRNYEVTGLDIIDDIEEKIIPKDIKIY